MHTVPLIKSGKPCLLNKLVLIALMLQILHKLIARRTRKAKSEMLHRLIRKLTLFEIIKPDLTAVAVKPAVKIIRRQLVDLQKLGALILPLTHFLCVFKLRQGNSRPFGKVFYRFRKRIIFILHHKAEHISSRSAAKAVVDLLRRRHGKGR